MLNSLLLACGLAMPSAQAVQIVVDTGHTPLTQGAISAHGQPEYGYNLKLSNAVAQTLQQHGFEVAQVAADGEEIALQERAVRFPKAQLFVSLHHDSIHQEWIDAGRRGEFSGFSVFVSSKNPDYTQSLVCAKAIGAGLLEAGEHPSLYHADIRPLLDERLGVHQFDDLVVLKTAPIPAVLVEAGVIANPDEAVRLADPAIVDKLAKAIAQGIRNCQQP
ncbi:N-acetylmuramoyl-L-alanine amidase family protein [Uliginosibacterium gangwonense]|uniref:N-acetylmuramoyl-L-alanine amidase family protein n=1 Tax=Uliginosibacterium gangwonense TaxID=392736 RepID=UPI000378D4A2|nr:N-acetylmuramoyl-L-alanine amidase [Uliginosibacterium gangwonense]